MKISDIYKKYDIIPSLQLHHYRVTAVAHMICDNWIRENKPDFKDIITACLLHDIGNIIKFNLDAFPKLLQPKGKKYWQKVKNQFIKKYGKNEHEATHLIAKEIGISTRAMELIHSVGFSKSVENYKTKDYSKKICAYSDQRVAPFGIITLKERMLEGRKRFRLNKGPICGKDPFNLYASKLAKIEQQIFRNTSIKPSDITDKSSQKIIKTLSHFQII
jgi:HD superfamily phosphodiesterase